MPSTTPIRPSTRSMSTSTWARRSRAHRAGARRRFPREAIRHSSASIRSSSRAASSVPTPSTSAAAATCCSIATTSGIGGATRRTRLWPQTASTRKASMLRGTIARTSTRPTACIRCLAKPNRRVTRAHSASSSSTDTSTTTWPSVASYPKNKARTHRSTSSAPPTCCSAMPRPTSCSTAA